MNDTTFQGPFGSAYCLNVEKFSGHRECERASVGGDSRNSVMISVHTVQVLLELAAIKRDRRIEAEADTVEHKYCRCCGKAMFPS